MRKILIALSSDSENLSLVRIYTKLIDKCEHVDVWLAGQNSQATKVFLYKINAKSYVWDKISENDLNQYDLVICGRTCYEAMPISLVLSFKGIILADNTALYDGKNVYGDIICVNGESNRRNITRRIDFPIVHTGCVKAATSNHKSRKDTHQKYFNKAYKKHILYVESGHFPFGKEGRIALSNAFCSAVAHHGDAAFIVKPRYFKNDCSEGRHRNSDHLYNYIEKYFNNKLPENLVLLNKNEDMEGLVFWADTVLYTYSSAHIEAIRTGKAFYHLSDIPSIETAEFRKNRMKNLEAFMDLAGCTIPYTQLNEALYSYSYANSTYCKLVDCGTENATEAFISVVMYILDAVNGKQAILPSLKFEGKPINALIFDREVLRSQRIKGYVAYKSCIYENRFDDYSLLDLWLSEIDGDFCQIPNNKIEEAVNSYLDKKVMSLINKIDIKSIFDRAFALRYYHETRRYEERDKLLNSIPTDDTAWLYYSALQSLEKGKHIKALAYLKSYIALVDERGFALTDAEGNTQLANAKKIVNSLLK